MAKEYILSLTQKQHDILRNHLFPGDGCEAIAIALCGRRSGTARYKLLIREIHLVPHEQCLERSPQRLKWPTESIIPLLKKAAKKNWSILKIHSHLELESFSRLDDVADQDLFSSVYGWVDSDSLHASAIMLPDGSMFGRIIAPSSHFIPLAAINLVGDDLKFWRPQKYQSQFPNFGIRIAQTFGQGTFDLLRNLKIAVIGCSGTGSVVIEQLARNGVGELLLVDPDFVEEKNLNRILNTTILDATNKTAKVTVIAERIKMMGLGTKVAAFQRNLMEPEIILAVAECDIVFGCLDTIEGRHILNRLSTFYLLPYFDVGVRLIADGKGSVDEVCGSVHYLQSGGSSLLSRGMYTEEELRAESLRRTNPESYETLRKEGYIKNVNEEKPAVISVNVMVAALAINEFLARIHPFRTKPNTEYAIHGFSLVNGFFFNENDGLPCTMFSKHVGRGDVVPLLDLPQLHK